MFWSSLTEKISIRVLDPFTIKPLDRKLILDCARATKGRILTVEDHYYEGNWVAPDWVRKARERSRGPGAKVQTGLGIPLRAVCL